MKIRFVVTLLAVAIAVAGAKAYALAPVIGFLPNPVIADDIPATTANIFVYPDAENLDTLAVDPDNTVTSHTIIWSFFDATSRIQINGRTSLNLITDDPNNPGTKGVGAAGLDDAFPPAEAQPHDSNVRTITFRDATLSPAGGPYTDPNVTATTTVVHTEVVTLFASDGSAYTSHSFVVYTESNGRDRLSNPNTNTILNIVPGTAGVTGWISANFFDATTLNENSGLCIVAPLTGNHVAEWISPYGIVSLVKNNVYRFRVTMDSGGTPITANTAPFWDLVVDNYDPAHPGLSNKFFCDFLNWDNEGGANSFGLANGRQIFDVWYAPMAMLATDWNDPVNGEFRPANDAENDFRLFLRILDTTGGTINGQGDAGTICLKHLTVDRVPFSQLTVAQTLFQETNINASNTAIGSIFGFNGANNTLATFSGGDLTLAPNIAGAGSGAWNTEVINVDPGDSTLNVSQPSTIPDNYPVQWQSNQLLMGRVTVQAPNAQGESNPPSAILTGFDVVTNELIQLSTMISSNLLGFPKQAASSDLVSFFYTHNKTRTTIVNGDRARLRLLLICDGGVGHLGSNGSTQLLGGIKILATKVDRLVAPQ